MFVFSPAETRVAGSLIEKEITTPEYYPLSINALVNACNQKSSRDPVMELNERDVRGALNSLEDQGLVRVIPDARVSKFEHRLRDGLNLRRDEIAVICLLLLRGPQTPAELRARAERLYAFDDTAAVAATLERLAAREQPLTRAMARQPGAREVRWRHLLDGETEDPVIALPQAAEAGRRAEGRVEDGSLAGRVASLEELVRSLQGRLDEIEAHLNAGASAPENES